MNVDGSNVGRLTFSARQDAVVVDDYPHWSPDGRRIVFQRTTFAGGRPDADVWLIDIETGQETRLTDIPDDWDSTPSFGADGNSVLFESDRGRGFDIYRLALESLEVTQLTNERGIDAQAKESPGGDRIAFASSRDGDSEIYVMDSDGANVRQITDNDADDRYPHWSPDSKWLVFESDRDGTPDIYVMNADGGDQRRLTVDPANDKDPHWVEGR
jgi:Tol biopolymer transport system component